MVGVVSQVVIPVKKEGGEEKERVFTIVCEVVNNNNHNNHNHYYHNYHNRSYEEEEEEIASPLTTRLWKMASAWRVISFFLVVFVLPTVLISLPLYARYHLYHARVLAMTETDTRALNHAVSSFWCQGQRVSSNGSVDAFLVTGAPKVKAQRRHITLKRNLTLTHDDIEYWGVYLLEGSSFSISSSARWPGGVMLVVQGEENLRKCFYRETRLQEELQDPGPVYKGAPDNEPEDGRKQQKTADRGGTAVDEEHHWFDEEDPENAGGEVFDDDPIDNFEVPRSHEPKKDSPWSERRFPVYEAGNDPRLPDRDTGNDDRFPDRDTGNYDRLPDRDTGNDDRFPVHEAGNDRRHPKDTGNDKLLDRDTGNDDRLPAHDSGNDRRLLDRDTGNDDRVPAKGHSKQGTGNDRQPQGDIETGTGSVRQMDEDEDEETGARNGGEIQGEEEEEIDGDGGETLAAAKEGEEEEEEEDAEEAKEEGKPKNRRKKDKKGRKNRKNKNREPDTQHGRSRRSAVRGENSPGLSHPGLTQDAVVNPLDNLDITQLFNDTGFVTAGESSYSSSEEFMENCRNAILMVELNSYIVWGEHITNSNPDGKSRDSWTFNANSSDYFYFIFTSDNSFERNDIGFELDLMRAIYDVSNPIETCRNATECVFPLAFTQTETVVVEVPAGEELLELHSFEVTTACQPRVPVYMVFILLVPFIILLFAFQ